MILAQVQTNQMEMQFQHRLSIIILGHLITNKCFHQMVGDYTEDCTLSPVLCLSG